MVLEMYRKCIGKKKKKKNLINIQISKPGNADTLLPEAT